MRTFVFPDHPNRPKPQSADPALIVDAQRVGVDPVFRRDLYFRFMKASWTTAFFMFFLLFMITNLGFALVYLLDPGGISAAKPGHFGDSFFFSVQTLTTIGFGTMAPQTPFTNIIVTIESAVGLLGVAICTGVFFAKASKPISIILFSKPAVVVDDEGIRRLKFRVGNMRGNEIVEAEMNLTAVIEIQKARGSTFRKLYDMELVRKNSPLFSLTWTVMHDIDEHSPLYGMNDDDIEEKLVVVICTMMGYDSTFGHQVHARHLYYPEQIYFERDFEDVLDRDRTGNLTIDYRKFHTTHLV